MPFADLKDVRLYYEDHGSGDPVLFVHGGLGTGTFHWRRQIEALPPHHRLIVPDLRGVGRSQRVPFAPDVFFREADDLITLIESLGISRLHVVGFSAGSMPARLVPLDRPDLVETLTLISAPDKLAGKVLEGVLHLLAVETREPKFARRLAELHGEDYWEEMCNVRLGMEVEFAKQTGGDVTRGRLGEMACPVLLVRGENDHMMPRAATEALAVSLPRAEIRELAGGNHFVPQVAAEWLNPILLEWFARHPIARKARRRDAALPTEAPVSG